MDTADDDSLEEWQFTFGLCRNGTAANVPRAKCDELLDLIVDWAEQHGYGIGGGYGPFKTDD